MTDSTDDVVAQRLRERLRAARVNLTSFLNNLACV